MIVSLLKIITVLMEVKTTDDPYETRLFELFKSHQGKNGRLDRDGLIKLCMSLELKNRGEALVNLLSSRKSQSSPTTEGTWLVSFQDFRAGLLEILGEEMKGHDNNDGGKLCFFLNIFWLKYALSFA